ncbi:tyrosine-type recombinase/integrase [Geodermatophilus nigrescens]|uniref:tyrosine-type recombinase/integrase n=1 Tax=Geodermatophilus nigrescens TaxID=1070870 RepID=UPI003CCB9468
MTSARALPAALSSCLPISSRHEQRSYRAHVDNVIVPAIGHVPIERLRAGHIEQLLIDAAAGRGPVTIRRIHATLRSALSYGVKTRRLPFNVASNVTPPNGTRPEVQPWSADELAAFLRYAETDRLGPLFEVIAACGLRRGEALGLRWGDLDLTNRTARIRQTIVDVGGRLQFSTPKTRSSEAAVPLTERAARHCCRSGSARTSTGRAGATPTRRTTWSSPGRTAPHCGRSTSRATSSP